jgi:hypothetical protein
LGFIVFLCSLLYFCVFHCYISVIFLPSCHSQNNVDQDQHYLQVKESLQQGDVQQKIKEYEIKEDGLLMHKNRIYVPSSGELRNLVLKEMHDVPYAGHPGY